MDHRRRAPGRGSFTDTRCRHRRYVYVYSNRVHPFQGAPASCAVPTDPSVLRMLASPLNEYTSFRLVVTRVQRIGDGTAQVYDHMLYMTTCPMLIL